jgi:hypothetical protein
VFLRGLLLLLLTANIIPLSPILLTLMLEAIFSSELLLLQEPHNVTASVLHFTRTVIYRLIAYPISLNGLYLSVALCSA